MGIKNGVLAECVKRSNVLLIPSALDVGGVLTIPVFRAAGGHMAAIVKMAKSLYSTHMLC